MLVRENIDFIRGIDPKDAMKIGSKEVILQRFRNLKKLDQNNWIEHWYVDPPFDAFYLYLSSRIVGFYNPQENTEEENEEIKENIQDQINDLIVKAGLNEYFVFDFHENVDEVCYKIKPEFKKIFKKIGDELNT